MFVQIFVEVELTRNMQDKITKTNEVMTNTSMVFSKEPLTPRSGKNFRFV